MIVGGLVAGTFLIKAFRRADRWSAISAFAAVGLVVASWNQILAVTDARGLSGELSAADAENAVRVIEGTSSRAGALIRTTMAIGDRFDTEIEPRFERLWEEEIFVIVTGRDALDSDRLAAAAERVVELVSFVDGARAAIEMAFNAAVEELAASTAPLPHRERLAIVSAATDQEAADRDAYLRRLDLAVSRLEAADRVVSLLSNSPGAYRFDLIANEIRFLPGGAIVTATGRQYETAVDVIAMSGQEAAAIADERLSARAREVLLLVEAALAPG